MGINSIKVSTKTHQRGKDTYHECTGSYHYTLLGLTIILIDYILGPLNVLASPLKRDYKSLNSDDQV